MKQGTDMPLVIRRRSNAQVLQEQLKIEGLPQDPAPITVAEARERLQSNAAVVLLDVRSRKEWEESAVKLPKALRVPANEIGDYLRRMPKDALIIPYCT